MIVSPSPPSPSASASEIPVVSPPAASPSPSGSPALEVFPPNTVYDGCLLIEPTGNTTLIAIAFTLANPQTGEYRAVFGQSPGGSLSGVGPARVGQNPIVIPMRATAFGTYDHLSITGPDGSPPALGPLTSQFPFQLNAATDKPNDCNPSTLKSPPSQALAAQQYLDAVAPVNAAASAFIAKVQTWTDATTSAAAGEDAAPLLAAFQTVDGQLQDLAGVYPPAADALVTDHQMVQRLISDLRTWPSSTPSVSPRGGSSSSRTAQLAAASNVVRGALVLPVISGSAESSPP